MTMQPKTVFVVVDGGWGREWAFPTRAAALMKLYELKPATTRSALLRIEERDVTGFEGWNQR